MDQNEKELAKLSLIELEGSVRSVRLFNKILHTTGILSMLVILIWPGIFTVIVGLGVTYFCSYLSVSSDMVMVTLKKHISKFK